MALECFGKNLCTLDTQTNSVVLNGRNGGLGDSGKASELAWLSEVDPNPSKLLS
jgi:hypothetical protein